jgi:hypothetical protein
MIHHQSCILRLLNILIILWDKYSELDLLLLQVEKTIQLTTFLMIIHTAANLMVMFVLQESQMLTWQRSVKLGITKEFSQERLMLLT